MADSSSHNCAATHLRNGAIEVIRKSCFQNVLVGLIRLGGMHPQAAVGVTIKGQRQALFAFPLLWC
jgi:hypothetical protein